MSEEIRNQNPGTEINDAALEGVSGGYNLEPYALDVAKNTCWECKRDGVQSCDGGSPEKLARCILDRDPTLSHIYMPYASCPFVAEGPVG